MPPPKTHKPRIAPGTPGTLPTFKRSRRLPPNKPARAVWMEFAYNPKTWDLARAVLQLLRILVGPDTPP